MKTTSAFASLLLSVAVAGAACTARPEPTPPEGPSQFLRGFSLPAVVGSINAVPNGPRCLDAPREMPLSREPRDSSFGGWSIATLTTVCDDPGDGTALGQGWAAGINAELSRLGAQVTGGGISTTEAGDEITDEWRYLSSGLRGEVTVGVLPAPEGRYWTIVRIFEPS